MSDDRKKQPVEHLREGALRASVWENPGPHGPQHKVTFSRTYRDQDGAFHETGSFGAKDLLGLQHLAGRAHDALRTRRQDQQRDQAEQQPARDGSRTRRRDEDRER
ncbi:hypothetical protein [Pontivivens ytuae]|uniref:Uncharacterized protein n=1 Tax=Pontivivens ytuae TaxID=2789856 RepID=A0A7S9LTX7_9RHOB|nr:hypothetical protein [Pontivivens ytuae]QPH54675.1 hypothetical protein I0K15_02515 [Pontivivens ytuae]QPH54754.1 hypothetical protein I0K15_02955 [Pontivivens ytuae]